jgi:hypothetical protein
MKDQWRYFPFAFILALVSCAHSPVFIQSNPSTTASKQVSQTIGDAWKDYSIYGSGLVSSEQSDLTSMQNASIYHINISIADDRLSLTGDEEIRYTNQEDQALNEVYFQLFPNMEGGSSTITTALVDGEIVTLQYEQNQTTVKISLPTPLEPGKSIIIHLGFKVYLPQDAGGNYGLFGYIDNILVLDGFYPAIPVFDDKGWHKGQIPPNSDTTFQDASFYLVKVTAPEKLVLVTSGVRVDTSTKAGKQTVTFAQGPSRDFYIAASDEFKVISQNIGETTVNSYSLPGLEEGAAFALSTAVNAIKAFNKYIGTYPYTEFDVVSTPMQGAYGIEYPGIVGINYSLYESGAQLSGQSAESFLESTVAHEVGHQWFYNVVGDDQINEPWLDESMTQYITALYYLDQYGTAGFNNYKATWYYRWDRVNRLDKAIGLPAGSYEGREYSGIVYGRGPIFIYELSKTIGDEAFNQFIKDYFLKYKWGIATTDGFKELAEKECDCDLTDMFNEWVYQ